MTHISQALIQNHHRLSLPSSPCQFFLDLFTPFSSSSTSWTRSGTVGGQSMYRNGTDIFRMQVSSFNVGPGKRKNDGVKLPKLLEALKRNRSGIEAYMM